MSYQDDRMNQIQAEINRLSNLKRDLRIREKSIKAREIALARPEQFQFNNVKQLQSALAGSLPSYMMPANVGALNEVAWPFYFQMDLDFGDDPSIASNVIEKGYFQVDQEAAFLMMSISVAYSSDASNLSAVKNAPVIIDIIDRQSSRRFSSAGIPLQMIGTNGSPTIFPSPMLVLPNAFIDVTAQGILDTAYSYTGSGAFQLSFFGYRTRIENADKVLSTIFS